MKRPRYRKLKPGPGLSVEDVAGSQRGRIHEAMIELVAERGYDDATVLAVTRRAGVSKRAFYGHFAGKQDCFLATYDMVQRRAAKDVMAAYWSEGDWQERLRSGIRAYAREVERRPQAARFALVESFTAGPAAFERIQHCASLFAAMIKESFDHVPDGVAVPPFLVRCIVGGIASVARVQLLEGREHELPGLVEELVEWTLGFRSEAVAQLDHLGKAAASVPLGPGLSLAAPIADGELGAGTVDRELILSATAELAARRGYRQLTVAGIRATAGVSRQCFDANFTDLRECFLAVLELLTERTIALVELESTAPGCDWPGGVHRALSALCANLARDPALARLAFVEVFAPGRQGICLRARLTRTLTQHFRAGAPSAQRPTAPAAHASLGAVWTVIHHCAATDRLRQLPSLAPTLSFVVLAPGLGATGAAEAIRAEQARMVAEAQDPATAAAR